MPLPRDSPIWPEHHLTPAPRHQAVQFRLGKVELELEVVVKADAGVKFGARFWLVSAEAKGDAGRDRRHRITVVARSRACAAGVEIDSVLLDVDLAAVREARIEVPPDAVRGWVCASADRLPLKQAFDVAIVANSLHLLDDRAKAAALAETRRVLRPRGVLAVNSAFYEGASPEESRPFYSRWIRRAVAEINRSLPHRTKSDRVQAKRSLPASGYRDLVACAGFEVLEMQERRVLLSQAAVRAISSYRDFAIGRPSRDRGRRR